MNKIKRYQDFSDYEMALEFINSFDLMINENDSNSGDWKSVIKKFKNDLKLHLSLIATFGAGIGAFVPVVQKMMENMNISTEITFDKVVLLTICSLTILYLEERKFKNSKEGEQLTSDSKSMLEELKMMGIGNGIVKLVIKSFEGIKNIFNVIGRHIGSVAGGVIDMFAYTSFLLPVMNGIYFLIGKYELTPETIVQNLIGLGAGVVTLIAKHGVGYIINKIKDKFKIKKDIVDDIVDDMENTTIKKFNVYGNDDIPDGSEPINDNRLI